MRESSLTPDQGLLLISEPFLADAYFKRSVVLLSEHDTEGTMGFILNKPTDLGINDAIDGFPRFDAPLYFGGPVNTDTLYYMHTKGDLLEGSREIINGVYWGGNFDQLKVLIETGQITPEDIRFYAGYSGWDNGQLDVELKEHAWMVSNGTLNFSFYKNPSDLWKNVVKSLGKEYALMADFPEDPSLN